MTLAVAIQESGLREDVQVGRGSARKPSKDGGRGRGPGGEACLIQLHPTISWRFAAVGDELKARAEKGDREAREAIQQALVGLDQKALGQCIGSGMRALLRARAHCAWAKPKQPWDWATVSMYATGIGCDPDPGGKVARRVMLYRKLRDIAGPLRRKHMEDAAPKPVIKPGPEKPVSLDDVSLRQRRRSAGFGGPSVPSGDLSAPNPGREVRHASDGRGRSARSAASRLGEVHAAVFQLYPVGIHGREREILPAGKRPGIRRLRAVALGERAEHAELLRCLPVVEKDGRSACARLHAA
jgi:hypothetical protein